MQYFIIESNLGSFKMCFFFGGGGGNNNNNNNNLDRLIHQQYKNCCLRVEWILENVIFLSCSRQ